AARGGEADEVFVIRLAPEIAAVGSAGPEVSRPFVVGHEPDSIADPHRTRDVGLQLDELAEGAAAVRIHPDHARAAAAVALPPCDVLAVLGARDPAAGAPGEPDAAPPGKRRRLPAFDGHRPEHEGLTGGLAMRR